jgi:hypothetical protein
MVQNKLTIQNTLIEDYGPTLGSGHAAVIPIRTTRYTIPYPYVYKGGLSRVKGIFPFLSILLT